MAVLSSGSYSCGILCPLAVDWTLQHSDAITAFISVFFSAINATISLLLPVSVILIYLLQTREVANQTEAMAHQTEAIRAGITPLLEVRDITSRDTNPATDDEFSNPDYIELEISNLGNEVAVGIQLIMMVDCNSSLTESDINLNKNINPMELVESPHTIRENKGGILGKNETKSMFAPVEFGIEGENISHSPPRFPTAIKILSDEGVDELQVELKLHYENLAGESTTVPIKPILCFDVNDDTSSFEEGLKSCEYISKK